MNLESMKAWEKRPDETNKSYTAFQLYLQLPLYNPDNPERVRSLRTVAEDLGHSAMGTVENWSAKYNWVDRAKIHDETVAVRQIVVRDVELEEYQKRLVERRTEQTSVMNDIIEQRLQEMLLRSKEVSSMEILRLVKSLQTLDDIERRIAQLPTTYRVTDTDETIDSQVYVIGG
jgi:hypothetical protein